MGDLKVIRLPDNTVLNIRDNRITGVDSSPTSGSGNIITSGGVYTAVSSKVNGDGVYNVVVLTTAQYEALTTKDANTMYVITDASPGSGGSTVAWGTESNNTVPLTVDGTAKTLALAAALVHKANSDAIGQVPSDNVVVAQGIYEPSGGFVFALPGSDLEDSGDHDYTLMTTQNAVKLSDEFLIGVGGSDIRGIVGCDDGLCYAVGTGNADGSEDLILATTADIQTALGNIETLLAAI